MATNPMTGASTGLQSSYFHGPRLGDHRRSGGHAGNAHDAAAVDDLLAGHATDPVKPTVMGDCAYGNADTLAKLADAGYGDVKARVAPAREGDGQYGKDDFGLDLHAGTVTCTAGQVVVIRFDQRRGSGRAAFDGQPGGYPLREVCTTSTGGRTVTIHPKEAVLQAHKAAQADPAWQEAYTGTRPESRKKDRPFRVQTVG